MPSKQEPGKQGSQKNFRQSKNRAQVPQGSSMFRNICRKIRLLHIPPPDMTRLMNRPMRHRLRRGGNIAACRGRRDLWVRLACKGCRAIQER